MCPEKNPSYLWQLKDWSGHPLIKVTVTNSPSSYRIGKAAPPSFKVYPDTIYQRAEFRDISNFQASVPRGEWVRKANAPESQSHCTRTDFTSFMGAPVLSLSCLIRATDDSGAEDPNALTPVGRISKWEIRFPMYWKARATGWASLLLGPVILWIPLATAQRRNDTEWVVRSAKRRAKTPPIHKLIELICRSTNPKEPSAFPQRSSFPCHDFRTCFLR